MARSFGLAAVLHGVTDPWREGPIDKRIVAHERGRELLPRRRLAPVRPST